MENSKSMLNLSQDIAYTTSYLWSSRGKTSLGLSSSYYQRSLIYPYFRLDPANRSPYHHKQKILLQSNHWLLILYLKAAAELFKDYFKTIEDYFMTIEDYFNTIF